MPLPLRETMFVNSDFTDLLKLFNDNHFPHPKQKHQKSV